MCLVQDVKNAIDTIMDVILISILQGVPAGVYTGNESIIYVV